MKLQKRDIDVSRVFLAFVGLQGDVARTALAVQLEPEEVQALAEQERWQAKLDQIGVMREKDTNFQITLNRALSFVQAQQLSTLIDETISYMLGGNREHLVDLLTCTTKNGATFGTKPITDLVKAAEAVQGMKARALGDVAGQPVTQAAVGNIALDVARALSEVAQNRGVDPVTIVQKSLGGPTQLP